MSECTVHADKRILTRHTLSQSIGWYKMYNPTKLKYKVVYKG